MNVRPFRGALVRVAVLVAVAALAHVSGRWLEARAAGVRADALTVAVLKAARADARHDATLAARAAEAQRREAQKQIDAALHRERSATAALVVARADTTRAATQRAEELPRVLPTSDVCALGADFVRVFNDAATGVAVEPAGPAGGVDGADDRPPHAAAGRFGVAAAGVGRRARPRRLGAGVQRRAPTARVRGSLVRGAALGAAGRGRLSGLARPLRRA